MTVPSEISRSGPYNGNGVATVFDYDFRILSDQHLRVIRADADGVETTLTLTADYTVSGVGDAGGGSITMTSAPASGFTITILRNMPFTQEMDLENQGAYYAETVEDAFDAAAMRDQQLQEQLDRAIKLKVVYDGDPAELAEQLVENINRLAESADEIDEVVGIKDEVQVVAGISSDVSVVAAHAGVLSGAASAVRMDEKVFVGNGVATAFTLDRAPAVDENVLVWVGGAIQDTTDYSVAGVTLTLDAAPANLVEIRTLVMTLVTANEIEAMRDQAVSSAASAAEDAAYLEAAVDDINSALQPATGRMTFADLATAATATIPAGVTNVTLQTYSVAAGPIGGADYREAISDAEYNAFSSFIKFTTANGRKFVAHNLENSSQVGVIGDGVGDDYARLQAYADYCGYTGRPWRLADNPKEYRTSQKIVFKTMRQLLPVDTTPLSDIHFSDLLPFQILGEGKAKIVATAAMTSVFELIFNTTFSNLGPFYSVVSGIQIDGNGLATACIKSNYVMHTHFSHLRLHGAVRGIEYVGYGGFRAYENVIRCKYGFYLVGGGGDSVIKDNDFYSQEATSACIYLGYYGGNMVIEGNTFTNEQNFATSYCVQMDGTTAAASEEIRDVVISDNEFCGFPSAIYARGKASGNKNIWNIKVSKNHVNPYGVNSYGKLIDAADCTDFDIFDNALNGKRRVDASDIAVRLLRCERFHVHDNFGGNYLISAFYDQDGVDNDWIGNVMDDVGKSGSSFTCMDVYGNAGTRRIERNTFRQSSASYAQNGIYERDGADFTIALNNEFRGMTNPQRKNATSTNSTIRRTVYGTAIPASGSWNVGDKVINNAPAASGNDGWVCVTAGAVGTWKTFGAIAA